MSATRLTRTETKVTSRIEPCTTGKSRMLIDSTISQPMPGNENTVSTSTDPASTLPNALGTRGPDVVLLEHFDHAGAAHPRHDAQGGGPEGHRGQDEVDEASAASGREQTQEHGEDDDEHDAEVEGRRRDSQHGHDHGRVVERRVPTRGRDDSGEEAEGRREERAQHREQRRVPQPRPDLVQDRALRLQRPPELASQDVEEVSLELDVQRLVEAELMPDGCELLGPGVGAGHEAGGIAGDDAHGDEYGDEDPEQHRE